MEKHTSSRAARRDLEKESRSGLSTAPTPGTLA
jgi:hypothetical protein